MKDYTVKKLIELIHHKDLSIQEISSYYLDRIQSYDPYLNSISEINPDIDDIINRLENEENRCLLHGIPIVIKDNIQTHDKMHTTANSYALKDFIAPYDATIVRKMRAAGMVILGKANLSEFAYFMSSEGMPSGYGSLHGQVISPYDKAIDPLGSSTGSAVSVAADLIPISIGTETNGSLMAPAYKNSISSIKPSLGFVSRYGIIPISSFQDTPGPMGKTVEDCALLLDVIYGYDPKDPATDIANNYQPKFYEATKTSVKGKRIAILNYIYEDFKISKIEEKILADAKEVLTNLDAIVETIDFPLEDLDNEATLLIEFKHDINAYFKALGSSTKISSLADLIAFNKKHPKRCLVHGQSIFEAAEHTSGDLTDNDYKEIKTEQIKKARKLEQFLIDNNLDAAISTMRNSYAPIYGNPTISVPAKALTDLEPISIVFFGKKYDDEQLISIAHHYEINTNYRIPPNLEKD